MPEAAAQSGSSRWNNVQYIGPDTIADIAASVAPTVVDITATRAASREELARWRMDSRVREDAGKKMKKYFGMDVP